MQKIKISMIAAMDEKRGIGYRGRVPWHIKEDLIRFRDLTKGHALIMGRKTFESLLGYYQRSARPMPKRTNIILSRNKSYAKNVSINRLIDTLVVGSIEEAISIAKKHEKEKIFIAGGAQIFKQGIKYANKLYLTIVKGEFKADAFFPDYSEFKKIIAKKDSSEGNYQYTFLELEKD